MAIRRQLSPACHGQRQIVSATRTRFGHQQTDSFVCRLCRWLSEACEFHQITSAVWVWQSYNHIKINGFYKWIYEGLWRFMKVYEGLWWLMETATWTKPWLKCVKPFTLAYMSFWRRLKGHFWETPSTHGIQHLTHKNATDATLCPPGPERW